MTDAVENQYIEMAYARVSSKNQTLARYITYNEAMNILHLKPYVYWKWIK